MNGCSTYVLSMSALDEGRKVSVTDFLKKLPFLYDVRDCLLLDALLLVDVLESKELLRPLMLYDTDLQSNERQSEVR